MVRLNLTIIDIKLMVGKGYSNPEVENLNSLFHFTVRLHIKATVLLLKLPNYNIRSSVRPGL